MGKYLNTIDIDHSAKAVLFLVIKEIKKCKYISDIKWRYSASQRGFHIKFWCSKNCCKCRKLYDDEMRIKADLTNREERERNILWDKKSYKTNEGKVIFKKAGRWNPVK